MGWGFGRWGGGGHCNNRQVIVMALEKVSNKPCKQLKVKARKVQSV